MKLLISFEYPTQLLEHKHRRLITGGIAQHVATVIMTGCQLVIFVEEIKEVEIEETSKGNEVGLGCKDNFDSHNIADTSATGLFHCAYERRDSLYIGGLQPL